MSLQVTSTRRSVLGGLLGTLAVSPLSMMEALAQAPFAQTEFTLYRNSQYPLKGTVSGCCWKYPGAALTANTTQFYADENLPLTYARWVVVWNPNTFQSPTGIRFISADLGPTNEAEIARFLTANVTTPIVDAVDITTELQALTKQKTLAHQTTGNGQWGCKIYGSWIECIWG